MDLVVALDAGAAHLVQVQDGAPGECWSVPVTELPGLVAEHEARDVRWVWADSAEVYAVLLRAGVRVRSAVDLRLVRAILRRAGAGAGTDYAGGPATALDLPGADHGEVEPGTTLFDLPGAGPTVQECLEAAAAQPGWLSSAPRCGRPWERRASTRTPHPTSSPPSALPAST